MQYNLKGTDLGITPEIREYLEKKLASLDKFVANPGAERTDVELQYLVGEARMYRAEFTYREPGLGNSLRAEARGTTLHEAIDLAEAELFREMTRIKEKRTNVMRRSAARVKDFLKGLRG